MKSILIRHRGGGRKTPGTIWNNPSKVLEIYKEETQIHRNKHQDVPSGKTPENHKEEITVHQENHKEEIKIHQENHKEKRDKDRSRKTPGRATYPSGKTPGRSIRIKTRKSNRCKRIYI